MLHGVGIALAYAGAAAGSARRRDGLFRRAAVLVELGPAGPGSPARRHHLPRCYEG